MPSGQSSEGGNVDEIQVLTQRVSDLGRAVDFWNAIMLWGLALAAVAAIIIGVSTRLIVLRAGQQAESQGLLSEAKDRKALADSKDKDQKIADALKTAGESNERAGKAQASLASAEQQAAEANQKAEGFRLDIAKANESAAKAQAQVAGATAEAARANLELARIKMPRSLNSEQRGRVANLLTRFSGTSFAFVVFGDPESLALLGDIDSALQQAGWNRVAAPSAFGSDIGFNTPRGVVSQVNDDGLKISFPPDVPAMEPIVRATAAALFSEGVPCEPHFSDRLKGTKIILISVGQKRL